MEPHFSSEFGSDNYAFKIVDDLEYNGFDSWFIPSSDSMAAIYQNIHSNGMGNFNESLIYWSSTKEGYFPYVMAFNFESWGGMPFPGSCLDVNGLLIARKILKFRMLITSWLMLELLRSMSPVTFKMQLILTFTLNHFKMIYLPLTKALQLYYTAELRIGVQKLPIISKIMDTRKLLY